MRKLYRSVFLVLVFWGAALNASAQGVRREDSEFGPVVRAYLGYLRNEQEVVDDRNSRHEISASYYRRNSNRIRALRQMAIRIARESGNDYLPELEAVAANEFGNLFENPPRIASLHVGKIFSNTFRFLGTARAGETFYVFARLDPYEQAELMKQEKDKTIAGPKAQTPDDDSEDGQAQTRSRRATAP
ncbi:MAG: hypothetical protein ICV68_00610 [Pyrinomonadaceae bacterium]|nr:hypothetical protein [Pyrinomonadaceae bacterium]